MPQRIQRKRTKGWRMPEGAVYVGRPTKWGNPYRWSDYPRYRTTVDIDGEWSADRRSDETLRFFAATDFENQYLHIDGPHADAPSREEIRRELAGKDLTCWCPEDQPCHADVLLRIANEEQS
jgi:hypothetical protein